MNINAKYILAFVAGAAAGSLTTYKLLKNKYEQIALEKIEAETAKFSKKAEEFSDREAELTKELENVRMDDYKNITSKLGYTDYSNIGVEEAKKEEVTEEVKPYVVTPEEFGEIEEYTIVNLTCYSDGILADDKDYLVDDVDNTVGVDSLNHFGEYEDDAVHVRNDRMKCYYEILRDNRKYKDVISANPHLVED